MIHALIQLRRLAEKRTAQGIDSFDVLVHDVASNPRALSHLDQELIVQDFVVTTAVNNGLAALSTEVVWPALEALRHCGTDLTHLFFSL